MYLQGVQLTRTRGEGFPILTEQHGLPPLLVVHSSAGDWQLLSLEQFSPDTLSSKDVYAELDTGSQRIWLTVLDGRCNPIGHIALEGVSHGMEDRIGETETPPGGDSFYMKWTLSSHIAPSMAQANMPSPTILDAAAHYFRRLFDETKDVDLLQNAIDAWMSITSSDLEAYPLSQADILDSLSVAYQDRFDLTWNISGVEDVISTIQHTIDITPNEDPRIPTLYNALGNCQRLLFSVSPNHVDEILGAIDHHRRGLSIAEANGSLAVPHILHSLSLTLAKAYDFTRDLSFLEEALKCGRRAVDETPNGDPSRVKRVFDLGRLYDALLEACEILEDGEEGIRLIEEAINLSEQSQDTLTTAIMLDELGMALLNVYKRSIGAGDVSKAVAASRRAVCLLPKNHSLSPRLLNNFGRILICSFYQKEDPQVLNEAIALIIQSIELTDADHHELPRRLQTLGFALETEFLHSENLTSIQESISCLQKAVILEPPGSNLIGKRVKDLADAFESRAKITGEKLDVQQAIQVAGDSVELLEQRGGNAVKVIEDIGLVLLQRFRLNCELRDIDAAIDMFQKAVARAAATDPILPSLLNDLGIAHDEKFAFTGQLEDAHAAVKFKRNAIEVAPAGHAKLPHHLMSLAASLQACYKATHGAEDIEEAIRVQQHVTKTVPRNHSYLPQWYRDLAHSFHLRFQSTGDFNDARRAFGVSGELNEILGEPKGPIEVPTRSIVSGDRRLVGETLQENIQEAVALSRLEAAASPNMAPLSADEWVSSWKRDVPPDAMALREAVCAYRTGAIAFGSTSHRLLAAEKWAETARSFDLGLALEGYEHAIALISLFVGLEQVRSRRHQNISRVSNLSRAAAATALEAGELDKALEWLERGRCLVWSQLNTLRTPVDRLRAVDEQLADRLLAVSQALEKLHGADNAGAENVELAMEWKSVISRVQLLPGFEEFVAPMNVCMSRLPPNGTVVVINVHGNRCDALALRAEWEVPLHIPLPEFTLERADAMVLNLRTLLGAEGVRFRAANWEGQEGADERALRKMRRDSGVQLVDVLRQLWHSVAHPVLQAIGYLVQDKAQLPRLWWCPTGPLSFLPLHAAGAYLLEKDAVYDFVISSYIPNISTLLNKLHSPEVLSDTQNTGVLIVTESNAEGQVPLPGVLREVIEVQDVLDMEQVRQIHLDGTESSRTYVEHHLPLFSCVHFACHAFQDRDEPLASGFILHDGPLKLNQIIQNNLKHAEIAFLSACQTSKGDEKLSEEAVHLAAGMIAAGYRGVVATMWSIRDQYAPDIARSFYQALLASRSVHGTPALDAGSGADALHYAVGGLRAELGIDEEGLLAWVPYIHFGI